MKESGFYVVSHIAPYVEEGFFQAFKLFWFFPLAAVYLYWRSNQKWESLLLLSLVLFASLQLWFAWDVSRLLGLAFPVVLFGAEEIRARWGPAFFVKFVGILLLLNFLVPQYSISSDGATRFYSLPFSLMLKYVFHLDPFAWME